MLHVSEITPFSYLVIKVGCQKKIELDYLPMRSGIEKGDFATFCECGDQIEKLVLANESVPAELLVKYLGCFKPEYVLRSKYRKIRMEKLEGEFRNEIDRLTDAASEYFNSIKKGPKFFKGVFLLDPGYMAVMTPPKPPPDGNTSAEPPKLSRSEMSTYLKSEIESLRLILRYCIEDFFLKEVEIKDKDDAIVFFYKKVSSLQGSLYTSKFEDAVLEPYTLFVLTGYLTQKVSGFALIDPVKKLNNKNLFDAVRRVIQKIP